MYLHLFPTLLTYLHLLSIFFQYIHYCSMYTSSGVVTSSLVILLTLTDWFWCSTFLFTPVTLSLEECNLFSTFSHLINSPGVGCGGGGALLLHLILLLWIWWLVKPFLLEKSLQQVGHLNLVDFKSLLYLKSTIFLIGSNWRVNFLQQVGQSQPISPDNLARPPSPRQVLWGCPRHEAHCRNGDSYFFDTCLRHRGQVNVSCDTHFDPSITT